MLHQPKVRSEKDEWGIFYSFLFLFLGGLVWFSLVWFDPKLGNKGWLTAATSSEVFGEEAETRTPLTFYAGDPRILYEHIHAYLYVYSMEKCRISRVMLTIYPIY